VHLSCETGISARLRTSLVPVSVHVGLVLVNAAKLAPVAVRVYVPLVPVSMSVPATAPGPAIIETGASAATQYRMPQ
jgi:hypothetical protein